MKGAETRKHDSTPKQFEVRIALTRNRGYEGRREEEQAEAASKAAVAAHARALTRSHRQAAQLAAAQKQASKQKEEGKEGGREGERAEDVDHYRRKLASDGRNDGRTEGGRTRAWTRTMGTSETQLPPPVSPRASAKLAFSDQMQH